MNATNKARDASDNEDEVEKQWLERAVCKKEIKAF